MSKLVDELIDVEADLVFLSLELVEDNADKVFAYASIEKYSQSFNAFFQVGDKIMSHGNMDLESNTIILFLELGTTDLNKIRDICKKYKSPCPTEIKMVYDVKTRGLNIAYKYKEICTPDTGVDPSEVVLDWIAEESEKLALSTGI